MNDVSMTWATCLTTWNIDPVWQKKLKFIFSITTLQSSLFVRDNHRHHWIMQVQIFWIHRRNWLIHYTEGPICDNQRTLLILLGTSTLFYFKNPLQSCCNGFTVKIALHHCGCYWYSSSLQRGARRLLLHGSQICWTALSWLQTCAWGI